MALNMTFIKKQEKKRKKEIHGLDPGISRRPRKRAEPEPIAAEKSVREPFSRIARFCAILLLATLLFQPIESAFASEVAGETSAPAAETISVEATEIALDDGAGEEVHEENASDSNEEVSESTGSSEEGVSDSAEEISDSEEGVVADDAEASESVSSEGDEVGDENATENDDVATEASSDDDGGADGASDEETSAATSTQEIDEEDTASSTENVENDTESTSEENISEEENTENIASTTEAQASSTDVVTVVQPEVSEGGMNDLNRYQFGVNDCVAVEDGFFYCTKDKPLEVAKEDKFYAAQDADGDFEIFISKGGVDTQITHNLYDDKAPFYDGESDTLVWHALIEDRYQIMRYELKERKMTQLTSGSSNSMEPVVSGSRTVWQSWVGNNWEIILDDAGVRTQLTQNELYDIDPHVRGDLVSWQTLEGEKWHVEVYDILTKKVEVMEAGEGASVENPRFVLMYDSKKANGDIETVGYDLQNKKIIPLGVLPVSVPKDIPEPEHSKETRALVQTAPNLKEEKMTSDDVGTTTLPKIDPPDPVASSTVATSTDLVIPSLTESTDTEVFVSTTSVALSEEHTLDLREPEVSFVPPVPDLVVTPTTTPELVRSSTVE